MKRFGAKVIVEGSDSLEAELAARRYGEKTGETYISPYNDLDVVAGQGTVGVELARQMDRIDRVFVSLGGGGLASGWPVT